MLIYSYNDETNELMKAYGIRVDQIQYYEFEAGDEIDEDELRIYFKGSHDEYVITGDDAKEITNLLRKMVLVK